jgi:molybdenum cofactor cytidylyltransferase
LLGRAITAAQEAGCSPIAVVVGAERERIAPELEGVFTIENPEWQRGMGSSIRAGLRECLRAFPHLEALILLACDQPFVSRETIIGLKTKREETKKPMVASAYANTLGIPALFHRIYFDELLTLDNEAGAKSFILAHRADVAEFPFAEGAIDIDTAANYQALCRRER